MKLKELLEGIAVLEMTADPDTDISGLSYDSRTTRPGDLFFAIRGFQTDGHKYIPKAVELGADVILCETAPEQDIPYVRVENARYALAVCSAAFFGHPSKQMKMIGMTGTNGKTTTSYLIKHMLEMDPSNKVGLIGTNGNMIGEEFIHSERTTPESFELQKLFAEMLEKGCTHVVMEVSSHSLVLDRVAGIHFDTAIYTNLTQDHLDFHGTMENYADAKKMLFSMCDCACINEDDPWSGYMQEGCTAPRMIRFSREKEDCELYATEMELTAKGVRFCFHWEGKAYETKLAIPGLFSVSNALGTIAAGLSLGVSPERCAEAICGSVGVKGRVEVVPTDGDYSILIDYAHTPDALENVLKTVKPLAKGRVIALFGCGGDRDRKKRPMMGRIAASIADICLVTSDNPRTEDPMAIIEEILPGMEGFDTEIQVICDRIEAIHWAIDHACEGDVILLAGKGHEDYQEINHVKHHMDEREIVADYLKKRGQNK